MSRSRLAGALYALAVLLAFILTDSVSVRCVLAGLAGVDVGLIVVSKWVLAGLSVRARTATARALEARARLAELEHPIVPMTLSTSGGKSVDPRPFTLPA